MQRCLKTWSRTWFVEAGLETWHMIWHELLWSGFISAAFSLLCQSFVVWLYEVVVFLGPRSAVCLLCQLFSRISSWLPRVLCLMSVELSCVTSCFGRTWRQWHPRNGSSRSLIEVTVWQDLKGIRRIEVWLLSHLIWQMCVDTWTQGTWRRLTNFFVNSLNYHQSKEQDIAADCIPQSAASRTTCRVWT